MSSVSEILKRRINLKNKKWFIGIDPGLTGAISLVEKIDYVDVDKAKLITVIDMPTIEYVVSSKKRKKIDSGKFFEIIKKLIGNRELDTVLVVLEGVQARPTNGSLANFSMGYTIGSIEAILNSIGVEYIDPSPIAWKKASILSSDKEASIKRAKELFENAEDYLRFKYHHDRAESILLAWFALNHLPKKAHSIKKLAGE